MQITPPRQPFRACVSGNPPATRPATRRIVEATARSAVESLEQRLLFAAASATVPAQPPAVEGAATYMLTVDYSSDVPINTATLGNNNIVVSGPGNFSQTPTFVSETALSDTSLAATYSLAAPNNVLSTTADGTYAVTVEAFNANAPGTGVADTSGNAVPAGVVGTFALQVTPAPLLELSNPVFTAGTYNPGSTIPFRATVTNDGHATAAPFTLDAAIQLNALTANTFVQVLGTASVSQDLAPGQSVVVNVPAATIPSGEAPGTYTFSSQINFNVTGAAHNSDDSFTSPTPLVVAAPTPAPTPVKIGALNPNFGVGGMVVQSTPLLAIADVGVEPDGKTVAVGDVNGSNGTLDFGVTRFNTDGSIDTTFGQNGTATTDFNGGNDVPIGENIQPDGKILVLGTTTNVANPNESSFALARYNTDGSLDTTFGTDGLLVISFAATGSTSTDIAQSMTLSNSGLIGVCGGSNADGPNEFAEAVLNPNGTLDTSFGGTGKVLTSFLGGNDTAYDIGFDPRNGDIDSVGRATNPSTGEVYFAAVRYLPNGSLDLKFGKTGKVITSINGSDDEAYGVAINAKGNIVATGATSITSGGTATSEPATVEYTASGTMDKSFGVGGMVTTAVGVPAVANEVAINPNGSVLIGGGTTPSLSSVDPSDIGVDIVQYTANGRPDPTFHGGQPLLVNFGGTTPSLARTFAPDVSETQAAMNILSHQHAIVQALGNLVVVANSGPGTTGIAEVVSGGASLTDALQTTFADLVPDDDKGTATVTVTNSGSQTAAGSVAVTLFASLDSSIDASSIQFGASANPSRRGLFPAGPGRCQRVGHERQRRRRCRQCRRPGASEKPLLRPDRPRPDDTHRPFGGVEGHPAGHARKHHGVAGQGNDRPPGLGGYGRDSVGRRPDAGHDQVETEPSARRVARLPGQAGAPRGRHVLPAGRPDAASQCQRQRLQ
jgi:uncharacterized delta-60 repeat protein